MMSGLRSQREKTITWVSERSGMASSGMCRTVQAAATSAAAVSNSTRPRLRALNSMMRSTMAASARGTGCGRFGGEGGERGAEARLGIDQEVRRGDDLVSLGDAVEHLVVAIRLAPEPHGARRERPGAGDDEDD